MLKRILAIIIMCTMLMSMTWADGYAIFGGIKGDLTLKSGVYYYQEVIFVTGKPIVLTGTITIPTLPDRDKYTIAIKYSLANTTETATLERTVTYDVVKDNSNSMGQTIVKTTIPVGGLKETIVVGGSTYALTSYQFSRSSIMDGQSGIDFSSGNVYYKKVFHINGDETTATNKLTLIGESRADVGYNNYWSTLETQIIDLKLSYESVGTGESAGNWDGSATLKFSTSKDAYFEYVSNDVQNISFRGGLLKSENTKVILQYAYDLPGLDEKDAFSNVSRATGQASLNNYTFETSQRLPVPKFNDIGGHWGEEAIFMLSSLEAFETQSFFYPDVYITREQFARAIINSITYVRPETEAEMRAGLVKLTRPGATPMPFNDIKRESPYYLYIERVALEGMMQGEGNGQFLPSRPLTRAEAITVMVRALGIDDIAPALPYDTGYVDDAQIPIWSKDAIYMARETGIVKGYPDQTIRPLALMTRAEAASMLKGFIDHLRKDITVDYREKLLHQF